MSFKLSTKKYCCSKEKNMVKQKTADLEVPKEFHEALQERKILYESINAKTVGRR